MNAIRNLQIVPGLVCLCPSIFTRKITFLVFCTIYCHSYSQSLVYVPAEYQPGDIIEIEVYAFVSPGMEEVHFEAISLPNGYRIAADSELSLNLNNSCACLTGNCSFNLGLDPETGTVSLSIWNISSSSSTECLIAGVGGVKVEVDDVLRMGNPILEVEIQKQNAVFYPNPVKEILFFQFLEPDEQIIDSEWFDESGALVASLIPRDGSQQLDIQSLEPGLYFVRFRTNRSVYFRRIIILQTGD